MRRFFAYSLCIILCFSLVGCNAPQRESQIVATTLPVYEFTQTLCNGTGISVTQLVTESVSCLHDYTLQVSQMQDLEGSRTVVMSGAGFEDFLDKKLLDGKQVIDASGDISLLSCEEDHHEENHQHQHDSHIWLSVKNAKMMAKNIYNGLIKQYPENKAVFEKNFTALTDRLSKLSDYADSQLKGLSCRDIITFHDGFSYMAEDFDLHIIKAIEEEAGSEASAKELIELTNLIREHQLPAIFTERNGSTSAAEIISAETGVKIFTLDMAISGESYFEAMQHNIDTIKEALG